MKRRRKNGNFQYVILFEGFLREWDEKGLMVKVIMENNSHGCHLCNIRILKEGRVGYLCVQYIHYKTESWSFFDDNPKRKLNDFYGFSISFIVNVLINKKFFAFDVAGEIAQIGKSIDCRIMTSLPRSVSESESWIPFFHTL